jgi:hypothetical protein
LAQAGWLTVQPAGAVHVFLTSKSNDQSPPSRPMPLRPLPPNGAAAR